MIVETPYYSTSGSRKSWYKHVTAVDLEKTNGYAFDGNFIKNEVSLKEGDIVIEKRPCGSVKNSYHAWIIWQIKKEATEEKVEIYDGYDTVYTDGHFVPLEFFPSDKFLSFRNRVAELINQDINPLAEYSIEELKAEIARRESC